MAAAAAAPASAAAGAALAPEAHTAAPAAAAAEGRPASSITPFGESLSSQICMATNLEQGFNAGFPDAVTAEEAGSHLLSRHVMCLGQGLQALQQPRPNVDGFSCCLWPHLALLLACTHELAPLPGLYVTGLRIEKQPVIR